jgi:formamidopyrimidine-DNA glycosylase
VFKLKQIPSIGEFSMPELPEVETTCRSIGAWALGRRIASVIRRRPNLRLPIPEDLENRLRNQSLQEVFRRAKYILLRFDRDTLLIHLGMSGSLRRAEVQTPLKTHDHVDFVFEGGEVILRYHDPRRFGIITWAGEPHQNHPLLVNLGIEPLDQAFNGTWLYQATRGRETDIKLFIMDAHRVVGVGNIYASEALFRAGIHPAVKSGRLSRQRCDRLCQSIRETLKEALRSGGSTLRDYVDGTGNPGAFQLELRVYGRTALPCLRCSSTIRQIKQGQRSTFYCPNCQR